MDLPIISRIIGTSEGYLPGRVYALEDGTSWEQTCRIVGYVLRDRPRAKVWRDRTGKYMLDIEGLFGRRRGSAMGWPTVAGDRGVLMRIDHKSICRVCGNEAMFSSTTDDRISICDCEVCGQYSVTREFTEFQAAGQARPLLSGSIRWANEIGGNVHIEGKQEASQLEAQAPKTVQARLDALIRYFSMKSVFPGNYVNFVPRRDYSLVYAENFVGLVFFLEQLCGRGLLEKHPGLEFLSFRLTIQGWQYVDSLQRPNAGSPTAFVAMWFDSSMQDAYDSGIKPGIEDSGYTPIRIDQKHHNNKIDDEIIAEIRRSHFLVADFTGGRGGVYYEAGFAMGLGIEVIWTVRADDLDNLHFDTRQYPHIPWTTTEELRSKLKNRILATIRAPHSKRDGL